MAEHPFASPLLAVLDAHGRALLSAAARTRRLPDGAAAFAPGDPADTLWFVVAGSILLETPRGARELGASSHFGTEALRRGAVRAGRAVSRGESTLYEVPIGALERILAQAGHAALLVREGDLARRQAYVALLLATPLGQTLGERVLGDWVGELREESWSRGARLFEAEEPARRAFIVVKGLVELVAESASLGFFAQGDVIGDDATLARRAYGATAAALGDVVALTLPYDDLRRLSSEHPRALALAVRATRARLDKQTRVRELSDGRATRHAVHELERLASATSLLAIELDACVRCGECARACAETHGSPRLTRRGEKVMLALADGGGLAARALLLAEACQHCRDPACLPECPTGAITREPSGAVALDEDLCTGCGACAKACPWDAIRLAPRAAGPAGASELVAQKCDLCRGKAGPECVSACPTGALFRADPARDLVEIRSLLGPATGRPPPRDATPKGRASSLRWLALAAFVPPVVALSHRGVALPGRAYTWVSGCLAGLLALLLLSQGVIKRVPVLRAWLQARWGRSGRSALARGTSAHTLMGFAAAGLVLAHAGFRSGQGVASVLHLVFWLLSVSGALGALCYRLVPARLTRLEQRGTLPEDHPSERDELEQRLYGRLSEQDRAVKELSRRVLLPYASAWAGPFALIASGNTRAEEEAALAARVAHLLGGRQTVRLDAVPALVKAAVAFRVLAARRVLEGALGLWLPVHFVLSALFALLLVAHLTAVIH